MEVAPSARRAYTTRGGRGPERAGVVAHCLSGPFLPLAFQAPCTTLSSAVLISCPQPPAFPTFFAAHPPAAEQGSALKVGNAAMPQQGPSVDHGRVGFCPGLAAHFNNISHPCTSCSWACPSAERIMIETPCLTALAGAVPRQVGESGPACRAWPLPTRICLPPRGQLLAPLCQTCEHVGQLLFGVRRLFGFELICVVGLLNLLPTPRPCRILDDIGGAFGKCSALLKRLCCLGLAF